MRLALVIVTSATVAGCFLDATGQAPGAGGSTDVGAGAPQGGSSNDGAAPSFGGQGADDGGATNAGGGLAEGGGGQPPLKGVGDCEQVAFETCDDCNTESGDGCGSDGQIELGWVCPDEGKACQKLSGFEVTEGDEGFIGGGGGVSFDESCPKDNLIVGYRGGESLYDDLVRVSAECVEAAVGADGVLEWASTPTLLMSHGGLDGISVSVRCPEGTFVVGFAGHADSIVSGLVVECAPIVLSDGALQQGIRTTLPLFGATGSLQLEEGATCGPHEAAGRIFGRSGGLLDRFGMGCHDLSATFCGDNAIEGPEECDLGDAKPNDGCSTICRNE
ncbi:MAG: hypothetical protein HOW73_07260 [Polyangiaceae bacterium]|nr:hypothetical protein [Polyangiaceae bacterium]